MLGYNAQSCGTTHIPLRHGGFTYLIFANSLALDMTNLGSNLKAFQQTLCPRIEAYFLLSSGPHFVQGEVFNCVGNSLA